jgi:hypothetical protein
MTNQYVMTGLMQRAAVIKGEINILEDKLAKERLDLAHVMATIRLFDPAFEGKRIYPQRPPSQRSLHFVQGEITRRCRDAMRTADGPLSAEDIALKTIFEKGLDPNDEATRIDMTSRLLYALHRLVHQGKAERIGHGIKARWVLTARQPSGETLP